VIHLYKYMHIYLWRDLRMMVLRMEDMRRSFGVSIDYLTSISLSVNSEAYLERKLKIKM